MFKPSLEELKEHIEPHHHLFPLARLLKWDHDIWFSFYETLSQEFSYHILLESGRAGKYSVMAYRPTHRLQGKAGQLQISALNEKGKVQKMQRKKGKILPLLREWMEERQAPSFSHLPDFCGGLLGFLSYDLVREIENLPEKSHDDLHIPDVDVLAFDRLVVYDHEQDQHWAILYTSVHHEDLPGSYRRAEQQLHSWVLELELLQADISNMNEKPYAFTNEVQSCALTNIENGNIDNKEINPSFSKEEFVQAVHKVQEYIAAGDVFQVNLSVRQSRPLDTYPLNIYEVLREINPSPYMGYLHFPDMQVISASPEQLIKVKGRELNIRPIAGTRPRGADREEDLRLAGELIAHEKERAEHVMLVDLERNDLGKVSRFGSVQVNEFMVIEEYSHVMHIVSNVQGHLGEGYDVFDVIEAVFPGGTITGAPKVRTMEIIEELEPVRRGLYTGSLGWIDFNGNMELNIVIRTLLAKDGKAHVQAGAGIVIDSKAEKEYEESLNKAKALWEALELSRGKNELSKVEE